MLIVMTSFHHHRPQRFFVSGNHQAPRAIRDALDLWPVPDRRDNKLVGVELSKRERLSTVTMYQPPRPG